jgi:hypothetical protein
MPSVIHASPLAERLGTQSRVGKTRERRDDLRALPILAASRFLYRAINTLVSGRCQGLMRETRMAVRASASMKPSRRRVLVACC